MFCPTCGAELTGDEKFCKYCGSEIGVPVTTPPQSAAPPATPAPPAAPQPPAGTKVGTPKKRKMKKVGIVIIVLLAIAGGSYGILVATTWGTYDQTVPFAYYASGADFDNITLNVGMSIADINVAYVDPVDGAPLVQGAYEQHIVGSMIGAMSFTNSSSGKVVTLTQTSGILLFFVPTGYCRVNLQLLKNVSYIFAFEAGTGNINVTIPAGTKSPQGITTIVHTGNNKVIATDVNVTGNVAVAASTGNVNITFTNVNVTGFLSSSASTGNVYVSLTSCKVTGTAHSEASTGNVDVTFTDTHVGGNFEFSTSTGNLDILFVNLTIDNDAPSFWANCSTGNLDLEFQQRVELGGIMSTYIETSTGNIAVSYKGLPSLSTGFKGVADASTGYVVVHPETGFSSGTGDTIQTDNYGIATSKINALTIDTSTGNVNVYATSLS